MEIIQAKLGEIAQLQKKLSRLNDELRAMISFLMACRTCEKAPSEENCVPCPRHVGQETPQLLANILKNAQD